MRQQIQPPYIRVSVRRWKLYKPGKPIPVIELRDLALRVGPDRLDDAVAVLGIEGELTIANLEQRLRIEGEL